MKLKKTYNDIAGTYKGCPGLIAPASFWEAIEDTPLLLSDLTNGCGAKITQAQPWYLRLFYKVLSRLINTMWFLNVSPPCEIHDWCYYVGKDERDREHYDHMLLDNHIVWIRYHTRYQWLRSLRYVRAMKFYIALRAAGSAAFWADK